MSMSTFSLGAGTLTTAYGIYNFANAKNSQETKNAMLITAAGITAIAFGYYFSEGGYSSLLPGVGAENVHDCAEMSENIETVSSRCEADLKKLEELFEPEKSLFGDGLKDPTKYPKANLYRIKSIVEENDGINCDNYVYYSTSGLFKRLLPDELKKPVTWGFFDNRFFIAYKYYCGHTNKVGVNTITQSTEGYNLMYDGDITPCWLNFSTEESSIQNFTSLFKNRFLEIFPYGDRTGPIRNCTLLLN